MELIDKPGKNDLVDYEELDEIGKLLKNDDIEAIKGKYLNQTHSEICAYYGSNKCLEYMSSQNMTISPLINLYAIERGHTLTLSIPHPDELLMLLLKNDFSSIPKIKLPPVDNAINVLYDIAGDFSIPFKEATAAVRSSYNDNEWNSMNQESIIKLVELQLPEYLIGCNIHFKTLRKIIFAGMEEICSQSGTPYLRAKKEIQGQERAKQNKTKNNDPKTPSTDFE
jgi:hypothetical protein